MPAVVVAIGGPIGVGKSTVARALAERLGIRLISAGGVFREVARRRGLSVVDLNRLAEGDPTIDRELDRLQGELAREGPCVVESRLSGWMVDADLKVWLDAPAEVRAARVAAREGQAAEAARAELAVRERSEWSRYRALYGIEMTDRTPYHLVIDTSRWDPEVIADALERLVRGLRPAARAR
ncbi:MAG: cytidylate kinase family protein [Armatimonadota bacterium]|nr:cytidylate kinase family protein [Armatimonadota bacterium]